MADDRHARVGGEDRLERLGEQPVVVRDQHTDGGIRCFHGFPSTENPAVRLRRVAAEDARAQIRKLLVTGDNRLKQGVDPAKARESFEQALAVAREAGLEDSVRPLVEVRLADLERLARESPRSDAPAS
jgi:hypothetical protein